MSYINRLEEIATKDCDVLRRKDAEYGGSWLKRGGIGAYFMLTRKWDRLEVGMTREDEGDGNLVGMEDKFDIISRGRVDPREEGILDDIGDLRRYLLLVEAEIRERQNPVKCRGEFTGHPDQYNTPEELSRVLRENKLAFDDAYIKPDGE